MEEAMKRTQIPAFGHWDYCDEFPITQYFESTRQAGLVAGLFWEVEEEEEDLFKVKPAYGTDAHHQQTKLNRAGGGGGGERKQGKDHHVAKQHKPRRVRTPKPVDEDLYKIPPDLLHQKPKRLQRRFLRSFVSGCVGINCTR